MQKNFIYLILLVFLYILEQFIDILENSNVCNMDNFNFQKVFDIVLFNGLFKFKIAGIFDGILGKKEKLVRE